jgi:hypothetical protein
MTTAYTALNPVPLSTLPTLSGVLQPFLANMTNAANATFAPDGLAAAPILGLGGAPLQGGEIVSGGIATLVSSVEPLLNGGALCWVLFSCATGAEQVGTGTGSQQAATVGQIQTGVLVGAAASGTANALSATIGSTLSALSDGQPLTIMAASANTGSTTLAVTLGATALGALPIVKGSNKPLNAGDIAAAGYPIELNYSATYNAFVMQNPATGISPSLGLVGAILNGSMSVPSAAASASFTSDQIVVATALSGTQYLLPSFSQTVNLASTGAGGMDAGSAPANGYVALYAIYNPSNAGSSILATNATSAVAPNVYGAGHMPPGYTASALISVWPTNASGQFVIGYQTDRSIVTAGTTVLNTTVSQPSPTLLSIATAVPPNARMVSGNFGVSDTSPSSTVLIVSSSASGLGAQINGFGVGSSAVVGGEMSFNQLPVLTPQAIYYTATNTAGTTYYTVGIHGYVF